MLTPKEILEKKFDKVMVWGYDMNAVDSFLEAVSTDYGQIFKENITLKNKMKVLVSKIEEYRAVDESMRQALLNTKNLAAEMSKTAQQQASVVRSEAEQYAAEIRAEAERYAEEVRREAERYSEDVRREAEQAAEEMRSTADTETKAVRAAAEAETEKTLASLKERIAVQEMHLEEVKTNVQVFIDKSIDLYKKELDALTLMREQELSYEIAIPEPILDKVPEPVTAESVQSFTPPVEEKAAPAIPAYTPVTVSAPVEDILAEFSADSSERPAETTGDTGEIKEDPVLPDTVVLPNLPPIPTMKPGVVAASKQPQRSGVQVYESDSDSDTSSLPPKRKIDIAAAAKRNAAMKAGKEEDNEETIILTPKPRFEFDNLQFGDKYSSTDKKRK